MVVSADGKGLTGAHPEVLFDPEPDEREQRGQGGQGGGAPEDHDRNGDAQENSTDPVQAGEGTMSQETGGPRVFLLAPFRSQLALEQSEDQVHAEEEVERTHEGSVMG